VKALYTTGPGQYGLADRPMPQPAGDEVLVRVAAAGFCMNDVRMRAGRLPCPYPLVPGHQFAGTVTQCGPEVKYARPGDRVAVHSYVLCGQCASCRKGCTHDCERFQIVGLTRDGGLAEYCAVPERCLYQLPAHLSLEEGALLENLANAVAVTNRAGPQTGERVVIIGATPIGLQALQVARLCTPAALVFAGTGARRLALAEQLGATRVVDLAEPEARASLEGALGGHGAHVVLMCDYTLESARLALDLAGSNGRVVIEAHADPALELPVPLFRVLVARAVTLRANRGWSTKDFTQAHELLARGLVAVTPVVTHRFALADWQQAFATFTDGAGEAAQVLLIP